MQALPGASSPVGAALKRSGRVPFISSSFASPALPLALPALLPYAERRFKAESW